MDWYNDFQRMVRADNIEHVIDKYREWRGRDCTTPEQKRAREDVKAVLDAIYASSPSSHAALIRLADTCARLTTKQFALLIHILRGGTFSEYAIDEGVTGAAVGQRWKTAVKHSPVLSGIKGGSNGESRRVLEGSVERGSGPT